VRHDILDRLRIDPGQRTLGQLLQDREAAAYEIERLRSDVGRLAARAPERTNKAISERSIPNSRKSPFRAGTLIRIAEVCELLGISRSTIYKRLSERSFPEPVRLGPRSVRWRVDAIEAWLAG
jgi:prophage regulatory protein